MSPIQGFTRLRYNQVGVQTVIGTPVAATRALPYRGIINVNPNRTDPDVDVGSIDRIIAPFAGAKSVTNAWSGKQAFNDLPYIFGPAGKGGVTATGGPAYTWTYQYASLTADSFQYLTDETGDDTNATYGIQGYGGVINDYTIGFPESLEAMDLAANLIFADANLATAKTGALSVDTAPTWVYGANAAFSVDTTSGNIGGTLWPETVHSASWSWNNNLDQKRFTSGSNSNPFALQGFGRGQRVIELTLQVAESALAIAEANTIDDDPVPNRYIQMLVTSPAIITGSTHYSWNRRVAMRLISVTPGAIGGNSTLTFLYRAFYDSGLGYAARDVVVNSLATQ